MYTWSSITLGGSRIWTRPLGPSERAFYYTGESAGASDVLHHALFEFKTSTQIKEESVKRAWMRLKRKYPLLASRVEEVDDDHLQFVVEEESLDTLVEGELVYKEMEEDRISDMVEEFLDGPRRRTLSTNLLASIDFLVHPRPSQRPRYSVLISIAHCISDGAASYNTLKTFLDFLAHSQNQEDDVGYELEERLAMVPAAHQFYMEREWSRAKKRWMLAMAWTVLKARNRSTVAVRLLSHCYPFLITI